MAGHSKWHNIKNRKDAVDRQRAKIFTDITKNIRLAVRQGQSGDPKSNASLRLWLDKARAANLPKEKIQKAIDSGLGKSSVGAIHEIVYEGFGPGGVGFLVVAQTDNPNRTSSEIKFIFSRANGSLGGPGSAQYLFQRQPDGSYQVKIPMIIEEPAAQAQLQDLIDSFIEQEDVEEVFTNADWPGKE